MLFDEVELEPLCYDSWLSETANRIFDLRCRSSNIARGALRGVEVSGREGRTLAAKSSRLFNRAFVAPPEELHTLATIQAVIFCQLTALLFFDQRFNSREFSTCPRSLRISRSRLGKDGYMHECT